MRVGTRRRRVNGLARRTTTARFDLLGSAVDRPSIGADERGARAHRGFRSPDFHVRAARGREELRHRARAPRRRGRRRRARECAAHIFEISRRVASRKNCWSFRRRDESQWSTSRGTCASPAMRMDEEAADLRAEVRRAREAREARERVRSALGTAIAGVGLALGGGESARTLTDEEVASGRPPGSRRRPPTTTRSSARGTRRRDDRTTTATCSRTPR